MRVQRHRSQETEGVIAVKESSYYPIIINAGSHKKISERSNTNVETQSTSSPTISPTYSICGFLFYLEITSAIQWTTDLRHISQDQSCSWQMLPCQIEIREPRFATRTNDC